MRLNFTRRVANPLNWATARCPSRCPTDRRSAAGRPSTTQVSTAGRRRVKHPIGGRSAAAPCWTARYARASAVNSSTVIPASRIRARNVPFAISR